LQAFASFEARLLPGPAALPAVELAGIRKRTRKRIRKRPVTAVIRQTDNLFLPNIELPHKVATPAPLSILAVCKNLKSARTCCLQEHAGVDGKKVTG